MLRRPVPRVALRRLLSTCSSDFAVAAAAVYSIYERKAPPLCPPAIRRIRLRDCGRVHFSPIQAGTMSGTRWVESNPARAPLHEQYPFPGKSSTDDLNDADVCTSCGTGTGENPLTRRSILESMIFPGQNAPARQSVRQAIVEEAMSEYSPEMHALPWR